LLKTFWNTALQKSHTNIMLDMLFWHVAPIKSSQVFNYFPQKYHRITEW